MRGCVTVASKDSRAGVGRRCLTVFVSWSRDCGRGRGLEMEWVVLVEGEEQGAGLKNLDSDAAVVAVVAAMEQGRGRD